MHLWDKASGNLAEFTTHFSFVIKSRGDIIPADGLTFFLAPNGSRLLPSSGYGKLGIYSDDKYFQANQPKFVAVEFDTWWNINIDPEGVEEHIDLKDYLPEWVTFGFSAATGYDYLKETKFTCGILIHPTTSSKFNQQHWSSELCNS
ncbi:hypothetical protein GH714_008476 [Hevea brasiliensis]|uniref:Legume lectin domain-containing protein n=1 Tax=Hevea brasiliensis TaxID=3981 RepID=A0A6A6L0E8_HEVBR|nr:hypothetical protein GH714_008476 [Hevea brasiliensis]